MKLDFNFKITRANGQELDGVPLAVADACEKHSQGDYKKYTSWAREVVKEGTLEVDKYNAEELKQIVDQSGLSGVVKDGIVNYIDSVNNGKDG